MRPLPCALPLAETHHSHGNADQASARRGALSVALIVSRSYDVTIPVSLRSEPEERLIPEKLISSDNHIDLTYLPPDLWSSQAPNKCELLPRRAEQCEDILIAF